MQAYVQVFNKETSRFEDIPVEDLVDDFNGFVIVDDNGDRFRFMPHGREGHQTIRVLSDWKTILIRPEACNVVTLKADD
jgi:cytochrome oxidase Cu insertion factor (SCO1/SenC/PrrC family)